MVIDPRNIEGRNYVPVTLRGGLDLVNSKYDVYAGSLQDCLNYESSDEGYSRSQGLLFYDGTADAVIEDMWILTVTSAEGAIYIDDTDLVGTNVYWHYAYPASGYTEADRRLIGHENTGTIAYAEYTAGSPNVMVLGITNITGTPPTNSATLVTEFDASGVVYCGTMSTAPSYLTDTTSADTIAKYIPYISSDINTNITEKTSPTGSVTSHGKIPGTGGITGGFQLNDELYGVRDYQSMDVWNFTTRLYSGEVLAIVEDATTTPVIEAILRLSEVRQRTDSKASLTFSNVLPTTDWVTATAVGIYELVLHNGLCYGSLSAHTSAATTEPGVGATWDTVWQLVDTHQNVSGNYADCRIYRQYNTAHIATRGTIVDTQYPGLPAGCLWKATTAGWEPVDLGYSIDFYDGEIAPSVRNGPLFVNNILSSVNDEGYVDWDTPTSEGASPLIAWTNPGNAVTTDATYATCALAQDETSELLTSTIGVDTIPNDAIRITGIEVKLTLAAVSGTGTIQFGAVSLNNGVSTYTKSGIKGTGLDLSTTHTFGSSTDLWNVGEIEAQSIIDGDFTISIQLNKTDAGTATASIDNVEVKVHYVAERQHVYIYDGTTDQAEAYIVAWQSTNGGYTWGTPTKPAGVMSLYDVTWLTTDPPTANWPAISQGMGIYTEPAGAGDLIATVGSALRLNTLPSEAEMKTNESMYESIDANFFDDHGSNAIYAVTGASPAFTFDGNWFSYIRTPFEINVDKPRHVEFHINMLALGYKTGHVLLSSVGAPHDFSGVSGGTSWGFRDSCTGLQALNDTTLGVMTISSLGSLTGTDPGTMTQKVINPNSGAQEYTVENTIEPYFADYYGVTTVGATDKFGDFQFGRMSQNISPWLAPRLKNIPNSLGQSYRKVVAAVSIRAKNQYRLYFNDGYILTISLFVDRAGEFTIQHYGSGSGDTYVPTFLDSVILSTGNERAVMGTADGSMYIIDGANVIQKQSGHTEMDAYIVTNPINLGMPESTAKYHHVVIQGQFYDWQEIDGWCDTNYVFDTTGAAQESIVIGDSSLPPVFTSSNNLDSIYLPLLADGYSLKLQTSVDGSKPHTLQSLLFRASKKGTDRNRTSKAY